MKKKKKRKQLVKFYEGKLILVSKQLEVVESDSLATSWYINY